MPKIKIKDLPGSGKVSKKDMKKVKGGQTPQILRADATKIASLTGSAIKQGVTSNIWGERVGGANAEVKI